MFIGEARLQVDAEGRGLGGKTRSEIMQKVGEQK